MSAAAAGKARSARRRAIESGRHAAFDMADCRKEAAMSAIANSHRGACE
jgi:hypothetical protein